MTKQLIRIFGIPVLAVLALIVGLITGKWFIFGFVFIALLVWYFLSSSGRKARVRFWVQGYKRALRSNNNDVTKALATVKVEFYNSKHADADVSNTEYTAVANLVEAIIKKEFRLERIIHSSGGNMADNLQAYNKEVQKLQIEIKEILEEQGVVA